MGLFKRKNKKVEPIKKENKEQEKGLELEDLDKVTAIPYKPDSRDWCPRVDLDLDPEMFRVAKKDKEEKIEDKEIDER